MVLSFQITQLTSHFNWCYKQDFMELSLNQTAQKYHWEAYFSMKET